MVSCQSIRDGVFVTTAEGECVMGGSAQGIPRAGDGDGPGGQLIQLPLAQRSCFTCVNARFPDYQGGVVTFCKVYAEVIVSETYAAEDCFTYERCDEGDQPDDMSVLNEDEIDTGDE